MIIRELTEEDWPAVIALYEKSQDATGLPSPILIPRYKLGETLRNRHAIGRYVAEDDGVIVGHGLIEYPNPEHLTDWQDFTDEQGDFIELGGAFVDPSQTGMGVWSALLDYRIKIVKGRRAIPVAVTWSTNAHVKSHFRKLGGVEVVKKSISTGDICLFVL